VVSWLIVIAINVRWRCRWQPSGWQVNRIHWEMHTSTSTLFSQVTSWHLTVKNSLLC